MCSIFSKIYKGGPFEPLTDYMEYMFGKYNKKGGVVPIDSTLSDNHVLSSTPLQRLNKSII